jgi:hypothetical protein
LNRGEIPFSANGGGFFGSGGVLERKHTMRVFDMFFWNVLVITLGLLLPAYQANGQDIICPEPPTINNNDEPCISVVTWNGLVKVLEGSPSRMLVLCPFDITKGESDAPVNLNTTSRDRLHIVCQFKGSCVLRGKGGHMIIHGANTSITLQQITFMGASNTAVSISSTAPRRQIFCDCHFIQYVNGAYLVLNNLSFREYTIRVCAM